MKILEASRIDVPVLLDMEMYMELAQIQDLSAGDSLESVQFWDKWLPGLSTFTLGRKRGYLAVFMDRAVEEEIDAIWEQAPARGFRLKALVQTMILGCVKHMLPEVDSNQCAPVPRPGEVLRKSLAEIGVKLFDEGSLDYKYSTLTYYPYRGGCQICHMREVCPKLNMPAWKGLFSKKE